MSMSVGKRVALAIADDLVDDSELNVACDAEHNVLGRSHDLLYLAQELLLRHASLRGVGEDAIVPVTDSKRRHAL